MELKHILVKAGYARVNSGQSLTIDVPDGSKSIYLSAFCEKDGESFGKKYWESSWGTYDGVVFGDDYVQHRCFKNKMFRCADNQEYYGIHSCPGCNKKFGGKNQKCRSPWRNGTGGGCNYD